MDKNFKLSKANLLDNFNKNIQFSLFDEISSTNDYLKEHFTSLSVPYVAIARRQTNGRGRLGRSFYSSKETGAYFSILLSTKDSIKNTLAITSLSSVIVCEEIRKHTNKNAKIKWVNDIYIDDKKVCGILTELISDKNNKPCAVVVGIGINLSSDFPDELKNIAANVGLLNPNSIIADISNRIVNEYDNISNIDFIPKYKEYSYILGKEIYFTENNKKIYSKAIDIDNDASLIVQTENGIKKLSSGEISVRLK